MLKDQEINEAKKILAFEVTKITRGKKQAKEAEEINTNIFFNNHNDNRINSLEIESNKMKDSSFSILDAVEKLNLVKSRSEIKRLINDTNYLDKVLAEGAYKAEEIAGNKIKEMKKIIGF